MKLAIVAILLAFIAVAASSVSIGVLIGSNYCN